MEIPGIEDLAEVGRGGMAVVYKGRQPAFSREVAVKVVTVAGVDERSRHRFAQELQAVGAISEHPNIITVHGAGETAEGLPYLVMAFQPRGSLADRLATSGPLPWAEVADIGVKMAGALESAHRLGVLHRDLKPENILVSSFGEPVLADFGIARLEGAAHLTASGMVTGTPAHSAPEALKGEPATAASDVYGLASTLYQLLTGAPAFVRPTDETTLAVMNRVLSEVPPDLRDHGVPPALVAVIEKAMAKDPADRYATAAELGQALRGAQQALGLPPTPLPVAAEAGAEPQSGETVVVGAPMVPLLPTPPDHPTPPPPPPPTAPTAPEPAPAPGRSRWPLVVVGLALVAAAVAGALLLAGGDDDPPPEPTTAPTTAPTTTSTSSTTTSTSSTTTTTVFVPDAAAAVPLPLTAASATSTASDGVDAAGTPVSYDVANTLDGDPGTAWRTEGDGVGEALTFDLAGGPAYLTQVGLIPGYAKVDPVDGTDRFFENRRILEVRWTFSDGTTQGQAFSADRNVQSVSLPLVLSRAVRLEILTTTDDGGRDFTAISEVQVLGVRAP